MHHNNQREDKCDKRGAAHTLALNWIKKLKRQLNQKLYELFESYNPFELHDHDACPGWGCLSPHRATYSALPVVHSPSLRPSPCGQYPIFVPPCARALQKHPYPVQARARGRPFFGAVSQVFNFNIFFDRARCNSPDEILRPGVRFQRPRHKCVAATKS